VIEAMWKIGFTRLVTPMARITHAVGIAEEPARDALITALEVRPEEGIPEHAGRWRMATARRLGIDSARAPSTTSRVSALRRVSHGFPARGVH
jgi:predicted RNA polymerase sigma factor